MSKIKYSREKKKKMRDSLLLELRNYDGEEDSKKLCAKLSFVPSYADAEHVLLFAPIEGEVNVLLLMQDSNKTFYFPKIRGDELKIFQIDSQDDLELGQYGILEPRDLSSEVSPQVLDYVIVPGLAYTQKGERLGRGMGFYDRFLKGVREKNPNLIACSLAFDFQIVSSVYADKYDESVDLLISL